MSCSHQQSWYLPPVGSRLLPVNLSRISFLLVLLSSTFVPSIYAQTFPTVTTAQAPLYPPLPRMAHIAGTVTLRVVTDGEKVAEVSVVNGQPMLAKAAQDNVKTWRFMKHEATTFETK